MPGGSDDIPNIDDEIENRREACRRFIHQKGGVELLDEFPRFEGIGFEEIVELAPVSRKTVSARLKDAREAGLVEIGVKATDSGTKQVYTLTKPGKHLQKEIHTRPFARLRHKIEALEEEFEDEQDDLQSWAFTHLISDTPSDRERDPHH